MSIRNRSTYTLTDRSDTNLLTGTSEEYKDSYIILPYIYTTPPLVPLRTRFRVSRTNHLATATSRENLSNSDKIYLSPEISKPSLAFSRKEINNAPRYPHIKLPKIEHKITPHRSAGGKKDYIYIPGSLRSFPEDPDVLYARSSQPSSSHSSYLPKYLENKFRTDSQEIKRNASMPVFIQNQEKNTKRMVHDFSTPIIEISVEISPKVQQARTVSYKKMNVVQLYPNVSEKESTYLEEIKAKFPLISFDEYAVANRNMSIQTSFLGQLDETMKDSLMNEMFDDEENKMKKEIFLSLNSEERDRIIEKFVQELLKGNLKIKEDAKKLVEKELETAALKSSNQETVFKYKKMKAEETMAAFILKEQAKTMRIETKLSEVKSRYKSTGFNKTSKHSQLIRVTKNTKFNRDIKDNKSTKPDKNIQRSSRIKPDKSKTHERCKTVEHIRIPMQVKSFNCLDTIGTSETDEELEALKYRRMTYAEGDKFVQFPALNREEAIIHFKQKYSLVIQKLDKIENNSTLPDTQTLRRDSQANKIQTSSQSSKEVVVNIEHAANKKCHLVDNQLDKLGNTQQRVKPLLLKESKSLEVTNQSRVDLKESGRISKSQGNKRNRVSNGGNQDIRELDSNSSQGKKYSVSNEIRIRSAEQQTKVKQLSRSMSNENSSKKLTKSAKCKRSKPKQQTDQDILEIERIKAARFEATMLKAEDQIKSLKIYLESEGFRRVEQEVNRSMNISLEEIPEQPSQTSILSISPSYTPKESQRRSSIQNDRDSSRRTSIKNEKELEISAESSNDQNLDEPEEDFNVYDYASKTCYQKFLFNFSKTLEKTILMYILAKKQAENKLRYVRIKERAASRIQKKEKINEKRRNAIFDDRRGNIVLKNNGVSKPNQTDEESLSTQKSVNKFSSKKGPGFLDLIKNTDSGKSASDKTSQYFTKRNSNEALLKKSQFLNQMASEHKRQLEQDEYESGGFGSETDSYEYESVEEESQKLFPDDFNPYKIRNSMIEYELKYFNMMKSLVSSILGPEADLPLVHLDEIPKDIYKDAQPEELFIENDEISLKLKTMLINMQKFDGYIFSPSIISELPRAAEYLKHYRNVNEIDFSAYQVDADVYESISLKNRFLQYSKILPNYDAILERQRNLLYSTSTEQPRPDDFIKDRIKEVHLKGQRDKIHQERGNQPAVIYGLRPIKSFTNLDLRTAQFAGKPINKRFKSKTNEYEEFVLSKLKESIELSISKENSLTKSLKSIHDLSTSRVIHLQKEKLNTSRSSSVLKSSVHRSMGVLNSVIKTNRI